MNSDVFSRVLFRVAGKRFAITKYIRTNTKYTYRTLYTLRTYSVLDSYTCTVRYNVYVKLRHNRNNIAAVVKSGRRHGVTATTVEFEYSIPFFFFSLIAKRIPEQRGRGYTYRLSLSIVDTKPQHCEEWG